MSFEVKISLAKIFQIINNYYYLLLKNNFMRFLQLEMWVGGLMKCQKFYSEASHWKGHEASI